MQNKKKWLYGLLVVAILGLGVVGLLQARKTPKPIFDVAGVYSGTLSVAERQTVTEDAWLTHKTEVLLEVIQEANTLTITPLVGEGVDTKTADEATDKEATDKEAADKEAAENEAKADAAKAKEATENTVTTKEAAENAATTSEATTNEAADKGITAWGSEENYTGSFDHQTGAFQAKLNQNTHLNLVFEKTENIVAKGSLEFITEEGLKDQFLLDLKKVK